MVDSFSGVIHKMYCDEVMILELNFKGKVLL
jgi:hypothetical protein